MVLSVWYSGLSDGNRLYLKASGYTDIIVTYWIMFRVPITDWSLGDKLMKKYFITSVKNKSIKSLKQKFIIIILPISIYFIFS